MPKGLTRGRSVDDDHAVNIVQQIDQIHSWTMGDDYFATRRRCLRKQPRHL